MHYVKVSTPLNGKNLLVENKVCRCSQTIEMEIECFAPEEMFLPYEELPEFIHDELDKNGPIPCEGSGDLDLWCETCRFGIVEMW